MKRVLKVIGIIGGVAVALVMVWFTAVLIGLEHEDHYDESDYGNY